MFSFKCKVTNFTEVLYKLTENVLIFSMKLFAFLDLGQITVLLHFDLFWLMICWRTYIKMTSLTFLLPYLAVIPCCSASVEL